MTLYALWHGGASYGVGTMDDVEEFPTIAAARREFESRTSNSYYPTVYRDTVDDGGPSMWLWFYDPREVIDPYPNMILEFGSRGGVRSVNT